MTDTKSLNDWYQLNGTIPNSIEAAVILPSDIAKNSQYNFSQQTIVTTVT